MINYVDENVPLKIATRLKEEGYKGSLESLMKWSLMLYTTPPYIA